ncbi:hypothetical protein HQQ81_13160 [Microbacteriaceae bacterium VKM Ac-2854]|nr:hypothetical protein [Microbacteriaceae bacterium VKM Ac-2854]
MTFTVLWENEHVRVLSYAAEPGAREEQRAHPDSVVVASNGSADALAANWLPAQQGGGIGTDAARAIVVELKGARHEARPVETAFGLSDTRLREIFGDEIVDARVLLTPEDPEVSRWDAEVSCTSPMQRHKGWAAYASVGVNVLTREWSFSCDVDDPGTCVHTFALLVETLDDPAFAELIEEGLAELG